MMHTDISLWGRYTPARETHGPAMNLHFVGTGAAAAQDDQVRVLHPGGTQFRSSCAGLFIRSYTLVCFQAQQKDLPVSRAPHSSSFNLFSPVVTSVICPSLCQNIFCEFLLGIFILMSFLYLYSLQILIDLQSSVSGLKLNTLPFVILSLTVYFYMTRRMWSYFFETYCW